MLAWVSVRPSDAKSTCCHRRATVAGEDLATSHSADRAQNPQSPSKSKSGAVSELALLMLDLVIPLGLSGVATKVRFPTVVRLVAASAGPLLLGAL